MLYSGRGGGVLMRRRIPLRCPRYHLVENLLVGKDCRNTISPSRMQERQEKRSEEKKEEAEAKGEQGSFIAE